MTRREPTLIDVPGILLRSVLRLVARILFLVGAMLVLASLFLVTWRTPRTPRVQQLVEIGIAVVTLVTRNNRDDNRKD